MTLDANRLRDKLREFNDPDYSSFRGFPSSRDAARQEWAAAFYDYFDQVKEQPALAPGHPALSTGNVQTEFYNDLDLTPTTSADVAATDFAGAWKKGVVAVTATAAGVEDGTNKYVYLNWTNHATLYTPLHDTLKTLFESPTTAALQRLTDIANAFHTASSGLMAAVTITNLTTLASTPGTMGVT
jgi:hypothetical protein